jgi:hypothetical protein
MMQKKRTLNSKCKMSNIKPSGHFAFTIYYSLFIFSSVFVVGLSSCKKSEDRTCYKSTGEQTKIDIPLDSVHTFKLYKNIKYRIFQDTLRKVVVKGGQNVVNFIDVENENGIVSIHNKNKCNFLRKSEDYIEVEIHYPYLKRFYAEPSDSVIFENTITADSLMIELREGGGSAYLDVDVNFFAINVSYGTADYTLSGKANNAEVKIQNNGFADALKFNAGYLFVYNNSTNDLRIDLTNSDAYVVIEGTGDIYYSGNPAAANVDQIGSGSFIKL